MGLMTEHGKGCCKFLSQTACWEEGGILRYVIVKV